MFGLIPAAEAFKVAELITPTKGGVASRTLAKAHGGNVTLFAFDGGEGLSEHRAPFDALVLVLEGALIVTVGGKPVAAGAGTIVRLPADIPHAIDTTDPAKMLLVMLKEERAERAASTP